MRKIGDPLAHTNPMHPFSEAEQRRHRKELDDLYPSAQYLCIQLCKQQDEGEICDDLQKQYTIEKADDCAIEYYVEEYVGDIDPCLVGVGVFLVLLGLTTLALFVKEGSRRRRGKRGGVSGREMRSEEEGEVERE
ncbi:MAG: hypothetical protein Q9226_008157 [Calogaya cf. arnoldii]